jgi:hypothetical protein
MVPLQHLTVPVRALLLQGVLEALNGLLLCIGSCLVALGPETMALLGPAVADDARLQFFGAGVRGSSGSSLHMCRSIRSRRAYAAAVEPVPWR